MIDIWCFLEGDEENKTNLTPNNTNMWAYVDLPEWPIIKSPSGNRNSTTTSDKTIEKRNDLIPLLQPKLIVNECLNVPFFKKIDVYKWSKTHP